MTVVTTRPNGIGSQAGTTLTGAADRAAAVNDNSDSSYITFDDNGDYINYTLPDPGLPAGAIIKQTTIRARCNVPNTLASIQKIAGTIGTDTRELSAKWATISTVSFPSHSGIFSPVGVKLEKTSGGTYQFKLYELYADVMYVAKPVTDVTSPTGALTTESSPAVNWTNTLDTDGGGQDYYQVKIFNAAQYGAGGFDPETSPSVADSGVLSGTSHSWAPDILLPDGSYRAYVKVAQEFDQKSGFGLTTTWSDWNYEAFTITVPQPGVPTLTVTNEDSLGRNRIDLDDNAGDQTTSWFEVQYSLDGDVWTPVRTLSDDGRVDSTGGLGLAYDYEAPNGKPVTYRARAVHDFGTGVSYSAWTTEVGTWFSDYWWIKHPTQPQYNVAVTVRSQPGSTRTARRGLFTPFGRARPVVVSDVNIDAEGEISFRCESDGQRNALSDLLGFGQVLLIQAPDGVYDWPDRWCSFGDYSRERALDASWFKYSFDNVPWNEVDRPEDLVVAWIDPAEAGSLTGFGEG